ncbi:Uncharacterised protein [Chlamydia trachomatis]|nr:Uncharacterised protein [Chlamydia trachomatis]
MTFSLAIIGDFPLMEGPNVPVDSVMMDFPSQTSALSPPTIFFPIKSGFGWDSRVSFSSPITMNSASICLRILSAMGWMITEG